VINLVQFIEDSALDPMYVDRTDYLAPDGRTASDAFAVMREAMEGKIGIGKVGLHGREYVVAIRPKGRGLVMHTLYHADEMQTMDAVEDLNLVPASVKPQEMELAQQVIQTFEAALDLATFQDEYGEGLRQVIEAKIAGREVVVPSTPDLPPAGDFIEALRKSLEAVSHGKKKAAKVSTSRTAIKRSRKAG
jgi:DNA end-binding protein Ku